MTVCDYGYLNKWFLGKGKGKKDSSYGGCKDIEIWESIENFKQSNMTEESGSRSGVAGKGLL